MKRMIASFILIIILYLIQSSIVAKFAIAGIKPNIFILITIYIGYHYGKIKGVLIGFVSGLLLDMTEGFLLGYQALMYLLIGYGVGFFYKFYHKDQKIIPILLIALSDLALNLMYFVSGFLLRNRLDFFYYLKRIILPEMVYSVIFSYFIYLGIDFFFGKLEKKKPEVKDDVSGGASLD